MPEIWKNKRSLTGKQNVNLKLYLCSSEDATCVCIITFYIKLVKLLRVLLFYICIRRPKSDRISLRL